MPHIATGKGRSWPAHKHFLWCMLCTLPAHLPGSGVCLDIGHWQCSRNFQQAASASTPWAFSTSEGWDRTSVYEPLVDKEPKDRDEAEARSWGLLGIMCSRCLSLSSQIWPGWSLGSRMLTSEDWDDSWSAEWGAGRLGSYHVLGKWLTTHLNTKLGDFVELYFLWFALGKQ